MANESLLGRIIDPFQKYIFHSLCGLPIFIAMSIIFYEVNSIQESLKAILEYFVSQSPSDIGKGALGVIFLFLSIIFLIGVIFLFGMIVDTVRHMIEEIYLVAKWSEYKIVQGFKKPRESKSTVEHKWGLFEKINTSEYFFTEYYGNSSISLAFLWGVLIWFYGNVCHNDFNHYLIWILIVFLLRPLLASLLRDVEIKKSCGKAIEKAIKKTFKNFFYRILIDFPATLGSILCLIFLPSLLTGALPYTFYISGILLITISFDLYVTRYRRYQVFLKTLFLTN